MKSLQKFTLILPLFSLSLVVSAQQGAATQQSAPARPDSSTAGTGDEPSRATAKAVPDATFHGVKLADAKVKQTDAAMIFSDGNQAAAQVSPRAPEPAAGKPAEAVPATLANRWRAVSTRQPGEVLKIKLKDGGMVKGKFKSASDAGLVLELKRKELSLNREEIVSVSLLGKRSAGKAAVIGIAVGGGVGAGTGAGIGAAAFGGGGLCCPRGKSAAVGAGILGGTGAIAGGLIGFATAGRRETTIYEVLPAK